MPGYESSSNLILGFTHHEIELILMSYQCIKSSKRHSAGWEISMEKFSELTNTDIHRARAQWKGLSSRLMQLKRLANEAHSTQHHDVPAEDCIVVRGGMRDDSDAAADAADSDEREQQQDKRRTPTRKARAVGKGKQIAKPSILDSTSEARSDEERHNITATGEGDLQNNREEIAEPSTSDDRVKQAWADIGDGMTEDKWNEMGDRLTL